MRTEEITDREILTKERICSLGDLSPLYRVECYSELDSTNRLVRTRAADGEAAGLAVFADYQTAGRGRMGRTFVSPPRSGVYATLLLRPTISIGQLPSITLFAAVATARAIERVAEVEVSIKWVNDLWIGARKACGILAEGEVDSSGTGLSFVALGIGINVHDTVFPEELLPIITTLEAECGKHVDRARLAAYLLEELSPLLTGELPTGYLDEYRRRSLILGKEITVIAGDRSYPARALRIEDDGNLIVALPNGKEKRIYAGEVSLRV